jgi:Uma2 family endonuclease
MALAAMAFPEPTLSLEEWADLPKEDAGELVENRIVEDEEVGYVHEVVVLWIGSLLRLWLRPRGGFVAASDCRFAVARGRGRKPDLNAYFAGSRKPPADGLIHAPPDIAVEVVSARPRDGRRDRVDKVNEYAAFGIRLYWIVDPQLKIVEILELGADGRYTVALSAADGVVASVPGCEGLSLDLDELWREVDQVRAAEEEV